MRTLTLAKTAPEGSATRPRILPPVLCPRAGEARRVSKLKTASRTASERRAIDGCMGTSRSRVEFFLNTKTTACALNKPCYNRARLENLPANCQAKNRIDPKARRVGGLQASKMTAADPKPYLKIGDVARLVGVSPSVIRTWESLGLARPRRTASKYRLYSPEDVKLLKRARFLRKVRGLNAPAIVQMFKREGVVRTSPDGAGSAIGNRLRQLRAKRRLSLAEVSKSVGISLGFLSALERSQMSASVGTLRRLARFYKTNILDFFDPTESNSRLVRPTGRKVLEAGPGVRMELLAWGNTVMEPHLFRIAAQAGSGESYTHDGEEFLYILRGQLHISLDGEEYRLRPGDSFYFESATPHRWKNPGRSETWVLWVNTPPTSDRLREDAGRVTLGQV